MSILPQGIIGFFCDAYARYGYEVYLNSNGIPVPVTERSHPGEPPGKGDCAGELVEYICTIPARSSIRDLNPLPPD
jgi:hypothetical protein